MTTQHIITRFIGLAFASLFWISCQVSKDVTLKKDSLPAAYRNVTATQDTTRLAAIPWRTYFQEKELLQLLDQAISRNNVLEIASQNIAAAQLRLKRAKWANVPELNVGINASTNHPSENSFTGMNLNQALGQRHMEDFNLQFGLSWEADIWGKIKQGQRAAMVDYLQSKEVQKAVQTSVISNVANGYYNLLMLDYQVEIAKKNVRLSDSVYQLIDLQFQSAQVSALAVEQALAQRLNAEKLVPILEQNQLIQENALSVLTGSFPTAQERSSQLNDLNVPPELHIGVPADLLALRPDVRQAELALDRANAEVGITKANLYPSLRISAQSGLHAFELSNWFTMPASIFGNVLGGLTQPILHGRKLKTNYEISLIEREKAVIQFRQTVLVAVSEVSDAYVQMAKIAEQQEVLKRRVASLQRAITNAKLLFNSGLASYLEVITAQANLLASELELANNKRELLSAQVALYLALGGGWTA